MVSPGFVCSFLGAFYITCSDFSLNGFSESLVLTLIDQGCQEYGINHLEFTIHGDDWVCQKQSYLEADTIGLLCSGINLPVKSIILCKDAAKVIKLPCLLDSYTIDVSANFFVLY